MSHNIRHPLGMRRNFFMQCVDTPYNPSQASQVTSSLAYYASGWWNSITPLLQKQIAQIVSCLKSVFQCRWNAFCCCFATSHLVHLWPMPGASTRPSLILTSAATRLAMRESGWIWWVERVWEVVPVDGSGLRFGEHHWKSWEICDRIWLEVLLLNLEPFQDS